MCSDPFDRGAWSIDDCAVLLITTFMQWRKWLKVVALGRIYKLNNKARLTQRTPPLYYAHRHIMML